LRVEHVILNPSLAVILSAAKNLLSPLRVNSAKNLLSSLRVDCAKSLRPALRVNSVKNRRLRRLLALRLRETNPVGYCRVQRIVSYATIETPGGK